MAVRKLEIRGNLETADPDVFTPQAVAALEALAGLDADRKAVLAARIQRRVERARTRQRISFLDPQATIPEEERPCCLTRFLSAPCFSPLSPAYSWPPAPPRSASNEPTPCSSASSSMTTLTWIH